mmetsp:Transcript_560/g.1286  ORF Transcript_560/g.1286 Transcript_560/m.1286 type:complete len:264 (+) Transcript_560:661-1452(+)
MSVPALHTVSLTNSMDKISPVWPFSSPSSLPVFDQRLREPSLELVHTSLSTGMMAVIFFVCALMENSMVRAVETHTKMIPPPVPTHTCSPTSEMICTESGWPSFSQKRACRLLRSSAGAAERASSVLPAFSLREPIRMDGSRDCVCVSLGSDGPASSFFIFSVCTRSKTRVVWSFNTSGAISISRLRSCRNGGRTSGSSDHAPRIKAPYFSSIGLSGSGIGGRSPLMMRSSICAMNVMSPKNISCVSSSHMITPNEYTSTFSL